MLENACVIASLRELLENPSWNPDAVVLTTLAYNGFPADWLADLEKYAPVKVWRSAKARWRGRCLELTDGTATQFFASSERILVAYPLTETRGHMECIQVKDFPKYSGVNTFITKREDEQKQQNVRAYFLSDEMVDKMYEGLCIAQDYLSGMDEENQHLGDELFDIGTLLLQQRQAENPEQPNPPQPGVEEPTPSSMVCNDVKRNNRDLGLARLEHLLVSAGTQNTRWPLNRFLQQCRKDKGK